MLLPYLEHRQVLSPRKDTIHVLWKPVSPQPLHLMEDRAPRGIPHQLSPAKLMAQHGHSCAVDTINPKTDRETEALEVYHVSKIT